MAAFTAILLAAATLAAPPPVRASVAVRASASVEILRPERVLASAGDGVERRVRQVPQGLVIDFT